jgi:hypothetical protein
MDGEVIEMDWDKPTPPTQKDVQSWIKMKRDYVRPPDPTPAPTRQEPAPTSLYDKISSFGSGLVDPLRGMAQSVLETGREGAKDVMAGNYGQAFGRVTAPVMDAFNKPGQMILERFGGQKPTQEEAVTQGLEMAGVPAPQIKEAYQQSDYPRMAGQAIGTIGGLYGMHKLGKATDFSTTFKDVGTGMGEGFGPVRPPVAEPIRPPVTPVSPVAPQQEATPAAIPQNKIMGEPIPEFAPKTDTDAITIPGLEMAKSGPPELADAAKKTETILQKKDSKWKRAWQDVAVSGTSIIEKAGKTGPALARLLTKTRLDADGLAGKWTVAAKEATAGLSADQIQDYVIARDTGIIPNDPAVIRALELRKVIDDEVVGTMKGSGAGFRTGEGKTEFQERTNYWPHIYPEGFFKNKQAAIDALIADGMTAEEATVALKNASRFGERIISPLHERQSNAPGYRTDLDADYMHLHDMAKRATEAQAFGPMDVADPSSPLSQLISGTSDPARVNEIVSQHLGRGVPEATNRDWNGLSRGAMQLETAMHLSQFALSNISQLATVPLRSNLGAYAKALGNTITNFKKTVGEAEGTGALQTIHQDILREVGGESTLSKAYGMKKSETFNRTVAAAAGKGTAEALFKQLKRDPTNKQARARLDDLLLEDVDGVLQQETLTPEQQARAGGRMAEITQGRAQNIDLPPMWSKHPIMDLILLYKKYAFRQTKIIKDAIMENPTRNIPLALALYTAMGEVIGDTKAGIKGVASGQGAGAAIAERGENLDRVVNNLGQSWAIGILGDVIGAGTSGSEMSLLQFLAGPVIGDATETIAAGAQAAKGNVAPLVKKAAKSVPVIGTGLAQRFGQKTNKRRAMPTLPAPPRLPTIPRP